MNDNASAAGVAVKLMVVRDFMSCSVVPERATAGSAGMDLVACIRSELMIAPLSRALVPTGIAVSLPDGYEAQVRSRSGLAVKHGVIVLNAPGTIDSDYTGEISVPLINLGENTFCVEPGMRIAQLVVSRYARVVWDRIDELEETERGSDGFGSTGT